MRTILLFCVLASLTLTPAAAQRTAPVKQTNATDTAKYIGLRHGPSLPPGLKLLGGGLVSAVGDEKEYGMNEVHRGTIKMLWFDPPNQLKQRSTKLMGNARPRPKLLPEKLLLIREHLQASQTAMQAMLKLSKTDRVSEYENGVRVPNLMVTLAYSRLGKVSMASVVQKRRMLNDLVSKVRNSSRNESRSRQDQQSPTCSCFSTPACPWMARDFSRTIRGLCLTS